MGDSLNNFILSPIVDDKCHWRIHDFQYRDRLPIVWPKFPENGIKRKKWDTEDAPMRII